MLNAFLKRAPGILAAGLLLALAACGGSGGGGATGASPVGFFRPVQGPPGTTVTLIGPGVQQAIGAAVGGVPVTVTPIGRSSLSFTIPDAVPEGPQGIELVGALGAVEYANPFQVTSAAAAVQMLTPGGGSPGTQVLVSGANLAGATGVSFGGVAAAFQVVQAGLLEATVPAGAATGPVVVTTAQGALASPVPFQVSPAPVPTSLGTVDPPQGPPGTPLRLTGAGLGSLAHLIIGGSEATFTLSPDGAIQTAVPADAEDGPCIIVAQGTGALVFLATPFTVTLAPPAVQAIGPVQGPAGSAVLIAGSGLASATDVLFSGTPATFQVQGDGLLQATVPAGAAPGPVEVISSAGIAVSDAAFTPEAAGAVAIRPLDGPVAATVAPLSGPPGTPLTLTGVGLDQVRLAIVGGRRALFTAEGSTILHLSVSPFQDPGPATIVLMGPAGPSILAPPFVVTPPVLAIQEFFPSAGAEGTPVAIRASGLGGTAPGVAFGATPATSVSLFSRGLAMALVPPGAAAGPVPVSVTVGGATAASSLMFSVGGAPATTLLTVAPPAAAPGTTVTLGGSGLDRITAVFFDATPAPFTLGAAGLQAAIPAGLDRGFVTIYAETPEGMIICPTQLEVQIPLPAITAITPTSGRAGDIIQIMGANFKPGLSVSFGRGVPAASLVQGPTTVFAQVPTGEADRLVILKQGADTLHFPFTLTTEAVAPASTVTFMEPRQGPPGTLVTLLAPGLAVGGIWIGASIAVNTSPLPGLVTFQIPPGQAAGPQAIALYTVSTPSVPTGLSFACLPPTPTVDAFTPVRGWTGQEVTLAGTGLDASTVVRFGGVQAGLLPSDRVDAITAVVPPGAGTGPIQVVDAFGQNSTTAGDFTVIPPAPGATWIQTVEPLTAAAGSVVDIRGSGLRKAWWVYFQSASSVPTVLSDQWARVRVPAGATTGFLRLYTDLNTPTATVNSPLPFTVAAPGPALPAITGFSPDSGDGTGAIRLTGTGLDQVTGARVGTSRLLVLRSTALGTGADLLYLAFGIDPPVSGPIILETAAGQTETVGIFSLARMPVVETVLPRTGPPGTLVAFTGTFLDQVASVGFGGISAVPRPGRTSSLFEVSVPPGAASGPLSFTTLSGAAVTLPGSFTAGASAALAYGLEKAYLTQGIQDGSVPLIAGKDAVFRAFVLANGANTAQPGVRVTLGNAGATVFTADLPGSPEGVPQNLNEQVPGPYAVLIPGALIQLGLTLQATLLPDPAVPADTSAQPAIPAGGAALAQDVRTPPTLAIQVVPLTYRDAQGDPVTGRTDQGVAEWRDSLLKRFPTAAIDLTFGAAVDTGLPLTTGTLDELVALRNRLEVIRLAAGAGLQNWHGVFQEPPECDTVGLALHGAPGVAAGRTSIGIDRSVGVQTFAGTLAHEVGHTKGREHAPCGGAAGVDPDFPNPPAGLGGAAYDVPGAAPIDVRTHFDLMGYCYPRWISAYTYKGLLTFFLADEAPAAPAPAVDCLVVSGVIKDGQATLDPALEIQASPGTIPSGSCTLSCLDGQGNPLLEVPFEPGGDEGTGTASFVLLLPMSPALKAGLASLSVGGPAVQAFSRPRTALLAAREPVAVPWGAGQVRVDWDPGACPLVLVRDPAGTVLAAASGGSAEVSTAATELELLMSDGVRTFTKWVAVLP